MNFPEEPEPINCHTEVGRGLSWKSLVHVYSLERLDMPMLHAGNLGQVQFRHCRLDWRRECTDAGLSCDLATAIVPPGNVIVTTDSLHAGSITSLRSYARGDCV